MKYIIKESELRATIDKIVAEEMSKALSEGLGSALKNTLKIAAKGTIAPGLLASDTIEKTNNILNGPDTIAKTVKDFFGDDKSKSRSGYMKKKYKEKRRRKNNLRPKRKASREE